jgi:hypothetical protein
MTSLDGDEGRFAMPRTRGCLFRCKWGFVGKHLAGPAPSHVPPVLPQVGDYGNGK